MQKLMIALVLVSLSLTAFSALGAEEERLYTKYNGELVEIDPRDAHSYKKVSDDDGGVYVSSGGELFEIDHRDAYLYNPRKESNSAFSFWGWAIFGTVGGICFFWWISNA